MGHRVTRPLQGLAEMSATKDGRQRGLSRNKGQVLVWAEGWGWAGQMFTWNGLSGHPQATGAAGAWHGACLPTTTGHCEDSDPSQMGTHPKAPRGTASRGLGTVTPSQALPAAGREGAGRAGWAPCSGSTCFSGSLRAAMPGWAGCALATEASGPQYSPLGRSHRSPRVLFCNCLLGRGRSVWWALGDINMTGSLGRCS